MKPKIVILHGLAVSAQHVTSDTLNTMLLDGGYGYREVDQEDNAGHDLVD